MKIRISENSMFGGFVGRLVNDNLTTVHLPLPFNVSHTGYTNRDKDKIIELCKRDARLIFGIEDIEVVENVKF